VVDVEYRLPTLETGTERMEWPEKDSSEYKFVRLVRHCGYTIGSLQSDDVSIEGCRVKFDDGETVLPEQKTRRERIKESVSFSGWWMESDDKKVDFFFFVLMWPLTGFISLLFSDGTNSNEEYLRGQVSVWLGTMIYAITAFLIYFL